MSVPCQRTGFSFEVLEYAEHYFCRIHIWAPLMNDRLVLRFASVEAAAIIITIFNGLIYCLIHYAWRLLVSSIAM